ncbi:MAG: hypothetical protein A4S12_08345 [Proteobacteria bacterium SG_bin5]|nr:MAG: hypothetical protein A4S12_08345 [Proteobacteria bacterium SG_bin5]
MNGWDAAPGTVALVAAPAMAGVAQEAIALAGLRAVLREAGDAPLTAGAPVLLIESEGLADDVLAVLLDAAAAEAASGGAALVVSFAAGQIDLVAEALLDTGAQLLCAPNMAERVAALTLARAWPGGGRLRETEGDRLAMLRDGIARLVAALTRLTGEGGAAGLADTPMDYRPGETVQPADPAEVRGEIKARRLRDALFGVALFEDPAWDMLLDLFAAELEGARVSVSSLCIAAAVAPTTALRWIQRLTALGLLLRTPDPADGRRAFITLSGQASAAMRRYWAAAPLRRGAGSATGGAKGA